MEHTVTYPVMQHVTQPVNRARYTAPDYVVEAYADRRSAIQARLQEFRAVPPTEWFYEFCYCLCTPQSKAVNAAEVVRLLKLQRFREQAFDPTNILRNPSHYIRFHNTKAKNLLHLHAVFADIEQVLQTLSDVRAIRSHLVDTVRGMGMKEASHVLRNIGYRGIAIIDRHILTHLVRCSVIDTNAFPSTRVKYEEIEAKWLAFADDIRIDPDELDLLFWSLQTGEILK